MRSPGRCCGWDDDGGTAAGTIEALDAAPGAREAIAARVRVSFAYAPERIAARSLRGFGATFDPVESERLERGNGSLAAALARDLGGDLRLGRRSRGSKPERPASGCTATSEPVRGRLHRRGSGVRAGRDRVRPAAPRRADRPAARLGRGEAAKLFVPLRSAPEPSAVLAVADGYWSWTGRSPGRGAQPVVNCFAGSAARARGPARGRRPRDVARAPGRAAPGSGARARGSGAPDLERRALVAGGLFGAGRRRAGADAAALARPAGRLAFAGEHTAGAWAGTMEGALRSGLRAAGEVYEAAKR